jgi:hypothetical protein
MIYLDTCTTNAKVVDTKSSTYGAKFELMCKSLQQNVTIHGITEQGTSRAILSSSVPKSLKRRENLNLRAKTELGGGERSMAGKLQSLVLKLCAAGI